LNLLSYSRLVLVRNEFGPDRVCSNLT